MAGIPGLLSKIAAADAGGTAGWNGPNGIKAQMSDIAALLLGVVKVIDNTTALSSLGQPDAGIVAVKGIGLYSYNPSNVLGSGDYAAGNGGGKWEFLCYLGPDKKDFIVGDSSTLTFTLTHGLNTTTPTVEQLLTLPGLPYTYVSTGTISVIDANTVQVVYGSAPGFGQYTISVKR